MAAYYNENNGYAAQWLRNLISAGHIAPGEVDERSIADVNPDDLAGFTQCHFFAGIGVWSYALRLAGWPDDRPVWTGSCPCQPFSGAGKRAGFDDPRHLWPAWFRLIRERRPGLILGEQVASRDGLGWLDLVQTDMEGEDYPFAAVDLCVAGVGGPHWRQRLWWMAYADSGAGGQGHSIGGRRDPGSHAFQGSGPGRNGFADGLADAGRAGHATRERAQPPGTQRHEEGRAVEQCCGSSGRLADAHGNGRNQARKGIAAARHDGAIRNGGIDRGTSPLNGFWRDADWLRCTDGKWRPVEPGSFPLAHGAPARVGRLRAYGNAICPQAAATFIKAADGAING